MPSLKRPVRTSTRWKAMQGGADETECLLFGLGATVGSVSQNLFIIRPWYVRRKHGWLAATQTLNQGTVEAADFFPARLHGRVGVVRGSRSCKSADFQSIGAGRPQAAALQDGQSGVAGMSAETRCMHSRVYANSQEAELGIA